MHDDPEIERLMAMSGEEILAEARAEGIDTDKLAHEMAQQFQVIARLVRERDAAREEVARLRAALEQYADANNWMNHSASYHLDVWALEEDGSERARRALESRDA